MEMQQKEKTYRVKVEELGSDGSVKLLKEDTCTGAIVALLKEKKDEGRHVYSLFYNTDESDLVGLMLSDWVADNGSPWRNAAMVMSCVDLPETRRTGDVVLLSDGFSPDGENHSH